MRYSATLFCFFSGSEQRVGIDAFEADEDARDSGAAGLLDEMRQAVAHGVDLNDELDVQLLLLAHGDEAVEDLFPVGVAGEIVVGDEEAVDALGQVAANDLLDVVGGAAAGLASLHVDDGAEGAQERAAAAGVEGGDLAAGALHAMGGKNRHGDAIERGQIVHVVVERLEGAVPGVAQNQIEAAFGFAGEERDAEIHGFLEFRRQLGQHRQAAGDVKASDANRNAGRAQGTREIHGVGKLVRLHADQGDHAASAAELPGDAFRDECGYWFRRRR